VTYTFFKEYTRHARSVLRRGTCEMSPTPSYNPTDCCRTNQLSATLPRLHVTTQPLCINGRAEVFGAATDLARRRWKLRGVWHSPTRDSFHLTSSHDRQLGLQRKDRARRQCNDGIAVWHWQPRKRRNFYRGDVVHAPQYSYMYRSSLHCRRE
jgi:hypothetical protein